MKRAVYVTVDVPSDVSAEEIADYIQDAIETMGGCRRPPGAYGDDDPGDPFFGGLNVRSVRVRDQTFVYTKDATA